MRTAATLPEQKSRHGPARPEPPRIVQRIREVLDEAAAAAPDRLDAPEWLDRLVAEGLDRPPFPGDGETLTRWQALADVASVDLSLAKLYEGHTDALAILRELGAGGLAPTASTWGVWAAEAPDARTVVSDGSGGEVRLSGAKSWCSGAGSCSHALLTAWREDGSGPLLIALPLRQPGIEVFKDRWKAIGMAGSASLYVRFDGATGITVGPPGAYLDRPGFWHGGAGIAACWYGGAVAVARALRRAMATAPAGRTGAFRSAALGKVDLALRSTAALLHDAAAAIDVHPDACAMESALRVRLSAERTATQVLDEVGRSLGAGPFCRDARFARLAADLPVFIRQSHAEHDFESLGNLLTFPAQPWTL